MPRLWGGAPQFAEGPAARHPRLELPDASTTRRELTATADEWGSAHLTAALCMGQPGATTVGLQVTARGDGAIAIGLAPVSTCSDLRQAPSELPGYQKWVPGLSVFSGGVSFHNGDQLPGVALQAGDRVELRVDRSDAGDPQGGTVVVAVNGTPVLGGPPTGPLPLRCTQDLYVVVSMSGAGNAVRIME